MQKITKKDYEELKNKIQILSEFLNGGKGSGNWGHAGRPGKRGGSGKGSIKGIGQAASESLDKAAKEEPQVSKDLKDTFGANKAEFAGFDFRLKGKSSLVRKIKTDASAEASETGSKVTRDLMKKATAGIKDNLRYTALLDKNDYGAGYERIKKDLESKGYEFTKVKNTMAFPEKGNPYRGVNCQVKNKNGYTFELQFHTPQSFDIKEVKCHKDYEIARNPKYNKEKRDAATARMFKAYEDLEVPKGADKIKPFKK